MGFGKMLVMITFGLVISPGSLAILDRRGGQSDAVCSPDFSWANNAQSLSPCLVAASVQGACTSIVFQVPKLANDSTHYDVLKTPDKCSCSWAAYNLLSACTACQGFPKSIQPWAGITERNECKPFLSSDTYFPSGVVLEGGRTLPFWSTINPKTWQDGAFNVDQARAYAQKGYADVNPAVKPAKKESPVAAIAGGVVGGVAILALGALAAWMIHRRKRRLSGIREISTRSIFHTRSFSDMSQKTATTYGIQQVSGFPVNAAPTIRTHASSVHSLPLSSAPATASIFSLPQSPTRQAAPLPYQPAHVAPREEIIEPYTLASPPSSPTGRPPLHRKGASDTSDTSLPVSRADDHTSTRQRINPPAYSGPTNGNGHKNRPGHGANPGSLDSQRSWDSLETRSTHAVHGNLVATATSNSRQHRNGAEGSGHDSVPIA